MTENQIDEKQIDNAGAEDQINDDVLDLFETNDETTDFALAVCW